MPPPPPSFRGNPTATELSLEHARGGCASLPAAAIGAWRQYETVRSDRDSVEQLLQDLANAGFEVPENAFSVEGFNLHAAADGWSFRAYGGVSLNLFFIRTDLTAMYDITSGALGGSVNVRFQI